ncbi:hypothetical protein Sango_0217200 [Sesamum angolense]|uniref:Uncharacterized protein n=1 Tax=Sesamum angolense TaxID=2727404 RepID=A0AAE1XGF8_9LAMI|nr:hypothetical protein Sango_0217200 [Sesamum angolense]
MESIVGKMQLWLELTTMSVGDPNDSNTSQKPRNYEENPEELQKEVNRLEGKLWLLLHLWNSSRKNLKKLNQLFSCKEQLKIEAALKNEALTQMATNQQLLRMRSEELDKSTLECMRVQERNMALAKELAAFKLASDLDLEDDEVMKLASLGNDVGSRETVDVLRKSLVIRNKSYKELMAKCNILGRGEARCLRKLEKATEKIKKLKSRIQELETAAEIKDNETLRVLKDQDARFNADSHENTMKRRGNRVDVDETSYKSDSTFISKKVDICMPVTRKSTIDDIFPGCTDEQNDQEKGRSSINEDRTVGNATIWKQRRNILLPAMRKGRKADLANKLPANVDDEVICYGETGPVQTSVHIKKETTSSSQFSHPGVGCFSGGLLGPDGTNWHLGKWCKKAKNQVSTTSSAGLDRSNARAGDLIAVGADGRGGRIKVMRSLDQSSLDIKDTLPWAKKCKHAAKPNKLQRQGYLQIEHFFQRTAQ